MGDEPLVVAGSVFALLNMLSNVLYFGVVEINRFILCECGEFVYNHTFKDYIKTSRGPSTPTIGHDKCGIIFDFFDGGMPRKYSSKKELKTIALKFGEKNGIGDDNMGRFLAEVDKLKSEGDMPDAHILIKAFKNFNCIDEEVTQY